MIRFLLVIMLLLISPSSIQAQMVSPPESSTATALPSDGTITGAIVGGVVIKTKSEIGPYTAFYIRPPGTGTKFELYYIRNDDVAKALERGAMVGLLMGAVQANLWVDEGPTRLVNIAYVTINGRKELTAASLGARLP